MNLINFDKNFPLTILAGILNFSNFKNFVNGRQIIVLQTSLVVITSGREKLNVFVGRFTNIFCDLICKISCESKLL